MFSDRFAVCYAALAYLLMRFANYCGLQSPCIICSRLDHVFRSEQPGYYRNLFCSKHRPEISWLISCNIHRKLVDGRSVCENCLSSHIEETKSNSDMQRVSLGNLGIDSAGFEYYMCLCCNEPWNPRPNAQGLPSLKSRGFVVAKPNINFLGRVKRRSGTKKIKDKSSVPAETRIEKTGFDPPSYVGYTELKITSESEHEIPFSEDEVSNCMVPDMCESKNESLVHSALEIPSKIMYSKLAERKQSGASEHYDVRCLHPDVLNDNGVCDSNEQLADQKSNPFPTLADITEASKKDISINKKDRALKLISKSFGADFETDRVVDDTAVVHSTDENPSAVHTSPVCGEEKGAPVFVTEEPMPTYNNGVNKDRSLPDQYSSGEGIQSSFSNLSPELQDHRTLMRRLANPIPMGSRVFITTLRKEVNLVALELTKNCHYQLRIFLEKEFIYEVIVMMTLRELMNPILLGFRVLITTSLN